ncbi:MAG: pentapeptide repeat-containing protein [Rhodobacteraceae bacterium]|nr:pentapeptide repeat-containing protein [Paracoccaceae bacterium]
MRDESKTPEAPAAPQRKLTPANENPWYVLMTLYGEQEGKRVDLELHEKNRRAWNAWASQCLSSEEKGEVVKSSRLTWGELEAWEKVSDDITSRYLAEYLRRNPNVDHPPELPDPRRLIKCKEIGFYKRVQFSGMLFCGSADFGESVFCRGVNYSNAMFLRDAYFYSVKFEGKAFFPSVSFSQWTEFGKAEFKKIAYFQSAKWSVDVDFREALFTGEANFEEASFKKSALFQSAKFIQNAHFGLATFEGFAYFAGAVFGRTGELPCLSNFSECHFSKPTSFRGAKFHDAFPNFSGAILHDKTSFTAKSVPTDGEKALGSSLYWPASPVQDLETARESCATIRHLLAKQGLPEDEHFFFRREMHFAGKIGSIWQRLPYLLFGLFSEYGYSILRPTLWLLGVWAFGFAAFWGYFSGCCVPAPHEVIERPMGSAIALSFSNLFPLFGFGRTFLLEELKALPAVLQFFSGFQTVASLPLLFFLGLGLRQRFRLR